MTKYATKNPIGSMDPKDLFDNAQNLDFAVNDITQGIWKDRFGRDRQTFWGMEQRFNQFIENSGYKVLGDYSDGPFTLTEYNQLIRYQNELWKLTATTSIPFTTTGNDATSWANDSAHFVSVGDAALRQELLFGAMVIRGGMFSLRDFVSPRDFKAVCDGVADDTEAVRKAHEAANAIGAIVTYSGIKRLAIQADAKIPVNTSVDFCGCRFAILNGMVNGPSWDKPFLSVFLVSDPDAPVITATGAFTGSLKKGSVTPLGGLVNKPNCFAALKAPFKIPDRAATGTEDYEQVFATGPGGRVVYPLSVDLTGYESQISVEYRVASTPITLSNAVLENKNFNQLRFFDIQRNNVTVEGFSMLSDNSAPAVTINEILYLFKSANCCINNVNAVCQNLSASDGTYLLHYEYVASTHISKIHATGDPSTWSSMAGDHINGLLFSECLVRRIDVHGGAHNLLIDSCTLNETGVSYGWGGGELRMSNCKVINTPALSTRGDYSGQHFGNIVIDGLTIERNDTNSHVMAQIACGANINTQLPDTIEIRNVTQVGVPSNFTGRLQLTVMRDATKAGQVQGPSSITIDGINSFARCRLDATLDYGSFSRSANVFRHSFAVRGAVGLAQSYAKGQGVVIPAPSITPVNPCVLYIDVSDSDSVLIDSADSNVVRKIDISNSIVAGVATALGSDSPQVTLSDCDIEFAATGFGANTPIGGDASGSNRYTRLTGCTIWPVAVDLSKVVSAQGTVFLTGSTVPVIPAGWTFTDFFVGKKTTIFRQ